jgi:putative membrane protein
MNRAKIIVGRRQRHASRFAHALTEAVDSAQRRTAARLVVVLRASSGSYRDVAYLVGALAAYLGLLLILFLPGTIHIYAVPFDVLLLFVLGAWATGRTRLRRWLTTNRRRHRQVKVAADAAFIAEGAWHSPNDAGLLIYWSRLERRIEILAGRGVLLSVPPEHWHAFLFHLRRTPRRPHPGPHFLACIEELGRLLAAHLPAEINNQAGALKLGGGA